MFGFGAKALPVVVLDLDDADAEVVGAAAQGRIELPLDAGQLDGWKITQAVGAEVRDGQRAVTQLLPMRNGILILASMLWPGAERTARGSHWWWSRSLHR